MSTAPFLCRGRRSGSWHLKKVLLSLLVLGGLSCFTITSAFALLSSETQNTRAKISSGTLTFSNTVNTATACLSYNGPASPGNVNSSCDPLFLNTTLMYPGTPATAQVTITNNGSVDGTSLSLFMPTCTAVTSPGAPAGGGNPCAASGAQFYIAEENALNGTQSCIFPTTGGTCGFAASTLAFVATRNSPASTISLGKGPDHGASRFFVIGMQLPSTASNTLQGEEALFTLAWHLSTT